MTVVWSADTVEVSFEEQLGHYLADHSEENHALVVLNDAWVRPPISMLEGQDEQVISVRYEVGVDGKVSSVRILGASSEELQHYVESLLSEWRFYPRIVNGKPVPQRIIGELKLRR